MTSGIASQYGLDHHGIENVNVEHWNLSTPLLYEEALRRREGRLAHLGPLVVRTGQYTGRSPSDKFIVREPSSESKVWWGDVNQALSPDQFQALRNRLLAYLQDRDLFVQDCFVAADPHRDRNGVAQPVRAQHVHSGGASGAPAARAAVHGHPRPKFSRDSRGR